MGKSERPAQAHSSVERSPSARDERRPPAPEREREPARAAPPESRRAPDRPRAAAAAAPPVEGAHKSRAKSAVSPMETFRLEVGSVHGIKPGNIVGAIANEAGIEGVHIGRVDIREDHSFVDLPAGMPKQIFKDLQKVRVAGRELRISRIGEKQPKAQRDTTGRHPGARPAERKMLSRRNAK